MAQQNVHLHGARGSHDDVHFLGPFFTARYDPGQSCANCVHDVAFFRKVGRCSQIVYCKRFADWPVVFSPPTISLQMTMSGGLSSCLSER